MLESHLNEAVTLIGSKITMMDNIIFVFVWIILLILVIYLLYKRNNYLHTEMKMNYLVLRSLAVWNQR